MQSVQADDLRRLLRYDKSTAGGLMTSQPLVFAPDAPVAEGARPGQGTATLPAMYAAQVYVCEPPTLTPDRPLPPSAASGSSGCCGRAPSIPGRRVASRGRVYVRPELPESELAARMAAYNLIGVAVCDKRPGGSSARSPSTTCSTGCCPAGWRRTGGNT